MSVLNESVEIVLDRPRHLRNNLFSEYTFEKVSGKNTSEFEMGSSSDLLIRLYSMLLWEDADLTVEYLGTLVDASNVAEVAEAMSRAVLGNAEDEFEAPETPETQGEVLPFAPAGTPSGPPDDSTSA